MSRKHGYGKGLRLLAGNASFNQCENLRASCSISVLHSTPADDLPHSGVLLEESRSRHLC
eukprot:1176680-Prorocentrum_minimum.AAC.3